MVRRVRSLSRLPRRWSGLEDRAAAAAERFWRAAASGVQWALAELQPLQDAASWPALLSKPVMAFPEDALLQGFAPFASVYQESRPEPSISVPQSGEVSTAQP